VSVPDARVSKPYMHIRETQHQLAAPCFEGLVAARPSWLTVYALTVGTSSLMSCDDRASGACRRPDWYLPSRSSSSAPW